MMKDKNGAIHSIGVRNSLFNIQHSSPFYIGTSGYRYDEWIGSFYRAQQHTSGRSVETDALALYQQHFSFLEISES